MLPVKLLEYVAVGIPAVVRSAMNFSRDFRQSYGPLSTSEHRSGIVPWNVTYTMGTSVEVSTRAGRFAAFPIDAEYPDGTSNRFFYAPLAGNAVRTETYNRSERVATTELTSYLYQALEPPRFLGLTPTGLGILALLIAAAVVAVVLLRRWVRGPAPPGHPPPGPPPDG